MTNVNNFISSYPLYSDENFENKIYTLKEFNDLKLSKTENVSSEPGKPFLHQELQARYFSKDTPYKNGIIYHGLGTGKTCTASLIVERFKDTIVNKKERLPAIIVVKNYALADSFRNEIARVCTKDVYIPELSDKEKQDLENNKIVDLSDQAKQRRLKVAISKSYKIVSMTDFLNGNRISYSNRLIIIDEAHSVRLQPGDNEEDSQYKKLHELLHAIINPRILLLTATPIWDKAHDIAGLVNLILDEEEQLPVMSEFDGKYFKKDKLTEEGRKEFKSKLKGKISYIRSIETSAEKIEMGDTISKDDQVKLKTISLYPSVLQEPQLSQVKFDNDSEKDGFMSKIRDLTNCVYPAFDNKGKIIKGKIDIENKGKLTKNLKDYFKEIDNLRTCSAKFATIIDILKNPNQFEEKAFIYNEFVNGPGGLLSLAQIMELHGFKWIKDISGRVGETKISSKSPGAFVVLSSDEGAIKDPVKIRKVLDVYNSDKNRYGNQIRIILGSQSVSQGYTFKATRQGHIIMPHWNFSSMDQALGRIYRAGSFNQLEEHERYAKFYRHACVYNNQETVDTYVYKIAENKEILRTQILRIMKESAWDCNLAYNRNVLPTDKDYSRACDLQKCEYVCDGGNIFDKSYEIVNENYNILYSESEINEYTVELKKLFRMYFSLDFKMISKNMNLSDDKNLLLLEALDHIIENNIPIYNRYGILNVLREDNDIYFLVDIDYGIKSTYTDSIYSVFPSVVENIDLDDASEIINLESDHTNIKEFTDSPSVLNYEKLSIPTKILLLEYIFVKLTTNPREMILDSNNIKIINIIWNDLGKKVYKMKDGRLVHNLYSDLYTDTSYKRNIISKGKLRVLFVKDKSWSEVSPEYEVSYIDEIKELVSSITEFSVDDETKIGGYKDGDVFKIVDYRVSAKNKKGRQCTTQNKKFLQDLVLHLGLEIDINKFKKHLSEKADRSKLISVPAMKSFISKSSIKDNQKAQNLDSKSDDEIKQLFVLVKLGKIELCSLLEDTLVSK